MEKGVLEKADKVIVAWPGIKEKLVFDDNDILKKTVVISNGFDDDDFKNIVPKKFSKFTIIYTGVSYKTRNPGPLFETIKVLLKTAPELKRDIEVLVIGNEGLGKGEKPFLKDMVRENGLDEIVKIIPYLRHSDCLSYILGADLLFLNTVENYVPGKVFEYVRARKNILALVDVSTTVAEIITETKAGIVISPRDTEKIVQEIYNMYKAHENNSLSLDSDDSMIIKYSRKILAGKLAEEFDAII